MIFWVIYFFLVTYLHIFNVISANAFYNLILCVLAFYPLPKKTPHKKIIETSRSAVTIILAIGLLWFESWLPPITTIWKVLSQPELRPSSEFIANFLFSLLSWKVLLFFFASISLTIIFLKTKLKKTLPFFFALSFFIILLTPGESTRTDLAAKFYHDESKKLVTFESPKNNYNIIIAQLCSFAWDDFKVVDFDVNPFFKNFDLVFTNFNSATSYSNPAVLRLLHSTCGQTPHDALYSNTNEKCYLFDQLRNNQYHTYTLLNHDGNYSNFKTDIVKYGHAESPLSLANIASDEKSFDGSPIYDDYEILKNFLNTNYPGKKAVFYNSITLHTGNTFDTEKTVDIKKQYSIAINKMTRDLQKLFTEIENKNEPTILILLGEHGASLRGSNIQLSTVREIPLPDITNVPMAIKIISPNWEHKKTLVVSEPTSYFAMSEFLSRFLQTPTQNINQNTLEHISKNLPDTKFLSENENGIVAQNNIGLFYRLKTHNSWEAIPQKEIEKIKF